MHKLAFRAVVAAAMALGLILSATACGSSGGGAGETGNKGTVTIGGFNFAESSILAYIYGGALKDAGYKVNYRLNLGLRPIVGPALEKGDIDMYAGYTASDLEFFDNKKGIANGDVNHNYEQLQTFLKDKNLVALTPAKATDQNAFAVTKETAQKHKLKKLSDLKDVAGQLVLGAPADCEGRSDCLAGLEQVYGVKFKSVTRIDIDSPQMLDALEKGDIQVGEVFSSDGAVVARDFVVLDDDKHIVAADAVVPIGRSNKLTGDAKTAINGASAKLTTDDLLKMNKSASVDKDDPQDIAADWLKDHGYKSS
jgi:osmoprotectant transport system substrate-binding protein